MIKKSTLTKKIPNVLEFSIDFQVATYMIGLTISGTQTNNTI